MVPVYQPAPTYVGPRYRIRPYTGVFVYGPRPVYHGFYGRPAEPVAVQKRHLPERKVDRANSLAVGFRAGSYFGAYDGANAFGDVGVGLAVRYRPVESMGVEVALQGHPDQERMHTMASASVAFFAFPWSRFSPYVLAGGSFTDREIRDTIWLDEQVQTVIASDPLMGPHAGIGLELAVGQRLALDVEARYVHYVNLAASDPTLPGALTTQVGAMWHF